MIVNKHENNGKNTGSAFCYSVDDDILQVQEEIINQLQYEKNEDIGNYSFYYSEMEKIHDNTYLGGSHVLSTESEKLDLFLGDLGLPAEDTYTVLENKGRYDGIC